MINKFFMVGRIEHISIAEPKDTSKSPSAVLLVKYGASREQTGRDVEFINGCLIRIPSYRYMSVKDKLKVGSIVEVDGHIQGVNKRIADEAYMTTELVADRVTFKNSSVLDFDAEE